MFLNFTVWIFKNIYFKPLILQDLTISLPWPSAGKTFILQSIPLPCGGLTATLYKPNIAIFFIFFHPCQQDNSQCPNPAGNNH